MASQERCGELLDLPGETVWSSELWARARPGLGAGTQQGPAEELVWRESGDKEAEAPGWFSSLVREVAWV